MTPQQIEEVTRCFRDIVYFAETYYTIIHPIKGKTHIKLHDYQKNYLKSLVYSKGTLTVHARQMGMSTMNNIYSMWYSFFHCNRRIMYACPKQTNAFCCSDKFKVAYENMPEFLKPSVKVYQKRCIEFDNGSSILYSNISENSLHGLTVNVLIVDDFAFVQPETSEKFWYTARPHLRTGGKIIVNSSANKREGKFYQLATNAFHTPWSVNKFQWYLNPENDEKWAENMEKHLDKKQWSQEYECQFQEV